VSPGEQTQSHCQAEEQKSRTGIGILLGNNHASSSVNGEKFRWVHFSEPTPQEEGELEQGIGELEFPSSGIIKRRISRFRHPFRTNASPNHSNDEETGLKK
jgi:hypothetical protein